MRILVTGGAGYIGSHTVRALLRAGHEPVVFDNLSNGHRWAVGDVPLAVGDIGDREAVRTALRDFGIGAVMHFAARGYVGESVRDPRKYFDTNVAGTLSLLGAMVDEGVKPIVFSSSCATYGMPERLPISEEQRQQPVNPYGWSKLIVEKALEAYGHSYDMQWLALRYFNAAGAEADGTLGEVHEPETHLIPVLIQAALGARGEVELFGTDYATPDGTAIRDYVHVMDIAEAHILGLEHLSGGGASMALNLGTGCGYSVRQIVERVEATGRRKVPLRHAPGRAGDPPELVADPRRAARVLGWRPKRSGLDEIIRTAWSWHSRLGRLPG